MKNKENSRGFFSNLSIRQKILLSTLSVLFLVMASFIILTLNGNRKLVLQVSKSEIINFTQLSAEAMGFGLQTLNFEYIRNIINRMKQEPRLSSLLILDNESNLIAGLNETHLQGIQFKNLLSLGEPRVQDEKITWAHRIKAYDPQTLREQVLGTVIVEFSLETVNQKILNEQMRFLLIAAGVLVVGVIISFLLARQISNPVAQLVKVSNWVGQTGNYRLRAEKNTGGELGLLIDQYNEMLSRIQKQNDEMHHLNEGLELRVQERTRDLEKAKEAAESGNRAKNDFLSRMSHELRTPLNAILGFSQLLKIKGWKVSREHREKNDKFVDHIINAANHLVALIEDVLELSQIESGEFSVRRERVVLARVLADMKSMLMPMAQKHNVQILCDPAATEGIVVHADSKRIKQVLFNLVTNAIKYNHSLGQVEVWAEMKDADWITVKVRDTGMGIPSEKADIVFEPFERLDWEFSSVEGIGIGLSISKKLVEAMGGEIGFHSTPGQETIFYFTLPRLRETEEMASGLDPLSEAEALSFHTPLSILYVEDNLGNRELVRGILESIPEVELVCVETAEEGIESARALHPDIIILDIHLPGMSGIDAVKLLQADDSTREIPVIALSASARNEDIEVALQAGFRDYVTKPIQIDQFLSVLKKHQPDRFPGPGSFGA